MNIEITIQEEPLGLNEMQVPGCGAVARFSGIVRGEENGEPIAGLRYEAYAAMAEQEMRRILELLGEKYPFRLARVQHRIGMVPVGESAIELEIHSPHRAEAFAAMAEFMDRLKQDVPIWKVKSLPTGSHVAATLLSQGAPAQATGVSLLHKTTPPTDQNVAATLLSQATAAQATGVSLLHKPASGAEQNSDLPHIGFLDFFQQVEFQSGTNLPHWRQNAVTYFVTWRTIDSMPADRVKQWQAERDDWLRQNPEPHTSEQLSEYHQQFTARWEKWLDECHGECILENATCRNIVEVALQHSGGGLYALGEFVVMPNHVHVVVTPFSHTTLSRILKSWKGVSARRINEAMGRSGSLWQKESFDHIIRSPEQLEQITQYIRNQAPKGRLSRGTNVAATLLSQSAADPNVAATLLSQSAADQATGVSLLHKGNSPSDQNVAATLLSQLKRRPKRSRKLSGLLHSIADVWDCIDSCTHPLPEESIPSHRSLHRVLSEPAIAACDQPPFDQTAMDGYAISDSADSTWQIIETVFAGSVPSLPLKPGQCTRILTGAPIPDGTLAVLKQEDCKLDGNTIRSPHPWKSTQHIRPRGSAFKHNTPLIPAGTRITAGALALLASAEITQLQVLRQPSALHLVTGSEVITAGGEIQPGKVRDSNGPMIAAFLHEANIHACTQHTGDDLDLLLATVQEFTGDLLLISGGSGPGDRDYTLQALTESGFTIHLSRINSRPGKPMIFATRGRQLAFGLPGNPLSHFVCYHAFVRRALARLMGDPAPALRSATLQGKSLDPQGDGRPTWSPAIVADGSNSIQTIAWSHSGDLSPLATANALILSGADPEQSGIASDPSTCQYLPL